MDAVTDQISDAEMAKKMRKRLKTSFNEAFEAHDKAMNSQSDIAKYNSGILRKLEKAFAANPEIDLLSKLPASYTEALESFAKDTTQEHDPLDEAFPPAKWIKITDSGHSQPEVLSVPSHLQHLQGSGEVIVKASTLSKCELISKDGGSGRRLILKLNDHSIAKIVPTKTDAREYTTLTYLDQHCSEIPAPKAQGMLQLNGQDLIFMSYVAGETLEKAWPSLDDTQKAAVSTKLDHIFSRLRRQTPQPSQAWGGVGGEGCKDQRRKVRVSEREILNAEEFEDFFFSNPKFGSEVYIKFLRELYSISDVGENISNSCVLTHGDLRPANIIVQYTPNGDVDISGIIDWEYSGFYPAFWEAVKLTNCMGCHETSDWLLHLPPAISPLRYTTKWLLDLVWDVD
ncbi:hypothetical protein PRZ48_015121 [Zasmidium cellare]|uniref:Aminoglycoside phosphotransferase domain-containing protein n=1 Tax=Zasmidium cellare TaxID=395010 RepID=A0ABR0DXP3_ZASCE|nr:hypothetical protein PRZ48_015121 [Zasmidium cellare]